MEAIDKRYQKILIKEYLTTNEFREYTGKSHESIMKMVEDGLPYYKQDNKSIYYSKKDYKAYMQKFKKGGIDEV